MCLFHKWEKWQRYDKPVPGRRLTTNYGLAGGIEHRQRKECEKCGKVRDEYIGFTSQ